MYQIEFQRPIQDTNKQQTGFADHLVSSRRLYFCEYRVRARASGRYVEGPGIGSHVEPPTGEILSPYHTPGQDSTGGKYYILPNRLQVSRASGKGETGGLKLEGLTREFSEQEQLVQVIPGV
jgi:hypothetical protein